MACALNASKASPIDVAYRYFATPQPSIHRGRYAWPCSIHAQHGYRRKHRQSFHRPDGRAAGVIEQTRRHIYIGALLGIPHLVIAINKMDLVNWDKERFLEIRDEMENFLPKARRVSRCKIYSHQRAQRGQRCFCFQAYSLV